MSKVDFRHIGSTRVILGFGIFLTIAMLAAKFFSFSPLSIWRNHQTAEFNFAKVVNNPRLWTGPKPGDRFDFTRLKDRSGNTLASSMGGRLPVMLVAVSPECDICSESPDQIRQVRDAIAKYEVKCYLVGFLRQEQSADNLFKYLDALQVNVPTFVGWEQEGKTPDPLTHMIVPVHFLIDGDSIIRGVWPGTARDKTRRDKMATQIISDTLQIVPNLSKAPG